MGFSRVPLSVPSPLCTVPCPVPLTPTLFLPPSPAALAFRTVTAAVWMRCHSSWGELRGVHSGKPVTAGTQPGWEASKSTSIPGAPFFPVQFKWFKHWLSSLLRKDSPHDNKLLVKCCHFNCLFLKREFQTQACAGARLQWGSSVKIQERKKKRIRYSWFFFFFLFKLNWQVTGLNREASVSFNSNSGKPTLTKVLQCWYLAPRLCLKKKNFLNKFALFSGKQFRVMAFGLSEASLQDL